MYGILHALARLMAVLGGAMLSALIVLTVFNVAMRAIDRLLHKMVADDVMAGLAQALIDFGVGPFLGTFEIIQAGIGFVIFAFLPICQIRSGHATVDVFTSGLSPRANRVLTAIGEAIFAAVLVLIAVQLFKGFQIKLSAGQTSMQLQIPLWWSYAICLAGAWLTAIISVFLALMRMAEVARGHALLPPADGGAET